MTGAVGIRSPCIFCRAEAAGAKPRAHILSQSLVEDSPALPLGCECCACNNRLSRLEKIFINDYLGSFYRVINLQQTKKGKPPVAKWDNATVRAVDSEDGHRTIQILIKGKRPETAPDSFQIELPVEKPVVVSRFICKVGIEALRYFNLPVLDPRLDLARTFAIYPQRAPFIPYAFRSSGAGPLSAFRVIDSPDLLETANLSVPVIVATIPGLTLTSPLVPPSEARTFLDFLRSDGWSIRDSDRQPKRQAMTINLRGASNPQAHGH